MNHDPPLISTFLWAAAKGAADEAGILMSEFKDAFEKGHVFTCALTVDYRAKLLLAESGDSAQGDKIGIDPEVKGVERAVGR